MNIDEINNILRREIKEKFEFKKNDQEVKKEMAKLVQAHINAQIGERISASVEYNKDTDRYDATYTEEVIEMTFTIKE
ncbi:MAG: hypothetical protein ACRCX2_05960 [Paraclostridium sp.]